MAQLYPFTDPVEAAQKGTQQIVSGDGIRVTDSTGKTFIDAVAALWCSSLGFNPERLRDVAYRQMGELAYYHSFMGRTPGVTEDLSKRLLEKLPEGMHRLFYATSGSEAVETAAKFVRYYQNARGKPEKSRIIAREGAYHGSGQVSAALTSMGYCHEGFDVPLNRVLRTGRPHYFCDAEPGESEVAFSKRRARELEALILREGADTIGAFIGEPAMGAGGVILPPEGYWDEIQNVLKNHDILLIADEIITGFGRTGQWFGCQTYNIKPDMMTLAKQMTASVFPMSAVAMTGQVYETISRLAHEHQTFGHGVTYGGHPVGAAIALECLDIYEELDLPNLVRQKSVIIAEHLREIAALPGVANTRIVGLLAGIEFEHKEPFKPETADRIMQEAKRRGVLFRRINNVLAISPPYITTDDELCMIMQVMKESILSVTGNMKDHPTVRGYAIAGE